MDDVISNPITLQLKFLLSTMAHPVQDGKKNYPLNQSNCSFENAQQGNYQKKTI